MLVMKNCLACKIPFEPVKVDQKFCSRACRNRAWWCKFKKRSELLRIHLLEGNDINLIVPYSDSIFNIEYQQIRGCYGWFRKGYYLYIGKAESVKHRLYGHHVVGRSDEIYSTDELHIWPYTGNLVYLEGLLIFSKTPPFNHQLLKSENSFSSLNLDEVPEPMFKLSFHPICARCGDRYFPYCKGKRGRFCCYECFKGEPKQRPGGFVESLVD